ncbi:NYN domain-containing protein [Mesorhizobium sp. BR1-1-16]|uniref:NYN domain-containing protein n=1 Tax=Mesorhizobium sp. BR1-1-16 TaxID=2876653 RepID=UPI001CCD9FEF|nr:NYN domain-containing protein [Mesorhizobium sp. BR1-1-16]MBZ9937448.1 NYN domain-containing protein [Mesorhizobium sp. BR1-1-16]
MTDMLKTVLFIDYDSLHLALHARDPALARRFAARPGALLEAIEAGTLIDSAQLGQAKRRVLMRRCYADPRSLGKARDSFVSQGFQIVDCPTLPGRERNSAEVQITLDTLDALGHTTAFDEFILLGADTDFTPLIYRLRAHNRAATIFATAATAGSYRAIADGILEERVLTALLASLEGADVADEDEEDEVAVRQAAGREDLAALARRIHNATNVPLFPPKVYAELFNALTAEIAENGYHFLDTAENVAGRLIAGGRKASRRQIAFVVKGLALKGHVFSDTDTPQRLADVFREQVIYLARHAGIEIDPRVERQVHGWIAGGSLAAEPPVAIEPATESPAVPHEAEAEAEADAEVPAAVVAVSPDPVVATLAAEAVVMAGPIEAEVAEASVREEEAVAATETEDAPEPELLPEPVPDVIALPAPESAEDVEPESEAELIALADAADEDGDDAEDNTAPEIAIEPAPVRAAPAVRPPVPRGPGQRGASRPAEAPLDPFESSLLAAIAEAVQAVEPGRAEAAPPVVVPEARIEPRLEGAPTPSVTPRDAAVGADKAPEKSAAEAEVDADIGDEIQRILSAYNQNRKPAGG